MNRLTNFPVLFALPLISALAGCGGEDAQSPLIAQFRPKLTLQAEPDGVQQVSELRETLLPGEDGAEAAADDNPEAPAADANAADEPAGPLDVVVMGVVGGMTNPFEQSRPDFPFTKDQALFFLTDAGTVAEIEAEGHHHADGEDCAFCAAHAEDHSKMLALVQFRDENGKVLSVDARDLFDLKEGETVVVQGSATVGAGDTLLVDATGLYVRK